MRTYQAVDFVEMGYLLAQLSNARFPEDFKASGGNGDVCIFWDNCKYIKIKSNPKYNTLKVYRKWGLRTWLPEWLVWW